MARVPPAPREHSPEGLDHGAHPAASQAEPAGASDSAARSGLAGRKLALLLLALLWPAQIFNVANVLSANTQKEIAPYFHTAQIAWF